MKKVKWGILSTANIAREKLIPALQLSSNSEVIAIASRQLNKAQEFAEEYNIQKAYGSYKDLLSDDNVEVIYNPLPNHLHVEWTIKALEAGKHVLCEKPIAMNAKEAQHLEKAAAKYPHLKIMEAFMYRFHPLIIQTKQLLESGGIGDIHSIHSHFSYYNDDPNNIRNKVEIGGGGLMDIGCYCISISRLLFGEEPSSVLGKMKMDPDFSTDWLTSGVMQFPSGLATFTCSTKMSHRQYISISGTHGHIEIENPFNPPIGEQTKINILTEAGTEEITISAANQYVLQCDAFARAIPNNEPVPISLDDSIQNMRVIDALKLAPKT